MGKQVPWGKILRIIDLAEIRMLVARRSTHGDNYHDAGAFHERRSPREKNDTPAGHPRAIKLQLI